MAGGKKKIFSFGNIYRSYLKCRRNKRNTVNALRVEVNAGENILKLEEELKGKTYRPSRSLLFFVKKPKLREIFAADFRDRVVHHVLVGYLEPILEKIFIYDSYSCRKDKGTHKAVGRLRGFIRKASNNGQKLAYYLQLDIKSYFSNIDKKILFDLVRKRTGNKDVLWLAEKIIFHDCTKDYILRDKDKIFNAISRGNTLFGKDNKKGVPIGNLTSQFFANVYLDVLDQFVKHRLKCRYYVRYTDDFVLLNTSVEKLRFWQEKIKEFLESELKLELNARRTKLQQVSNGIDFLGYIVRKDYVLVRRRVVNNMDRKLKYFERHGHTGLSKETIEHLRASVQSYLGHFKWANSYRLREKISKRKIIADFFKINEYKLVPKDLRED